MITRPIRPVALTMHACKTLAQLAEHFGVQVWQVRRLFSMGMLAQPQKVGKLWVVFDEDLPKVEHALRMARYLAPDWKAGEIRSC